MDPCRQNKIHGLIYFNFPNFNRITRPLKGVAKVPQPLIAFRFAGLVMPFFGQQAIRGLLQANLTLLKLDQYVGDKLFHLRQAKAVIGFCKMTLALA